MKFIHIADVHLGAGPDAGGAYTQGRARELWDSFERLVKICKKEKTDLLLIAGDLFHRQPLLRELREVDYIFSMLTHTKVVLIAGNHDYLKPSSYYLTYEWNSRVYPLLSDKLEAVEFEELGTCVYGLSYTLREIKEALYDNAFPKKRQPIEILLAHGGDEKHIPINKKQLGSLGYDYVALGHIHLPMEVEKNRMYYAGALEPTDKNDVGPHGYIRGEIRNGKTRVQFVPFASREYIHMEVPVEKNLPGRAVRERVEKAIQEKGIRNIYKIILTGFRDADMTYDLEGMDRYGNILEFIDDTRPAYDFEKLQKQNEDNLLGKYIGKLKESPEESIECRALFEGVRALLETKRG